jgi:hypothetical protein
MTKQEKKLYDKKYYHLNKEKRSFQMKEWYLKNKIKILEKHKEYKLKHKKQITKQKREYRLKNKKLFDKYYYKNKSKIVERKRIRNKQRRETDINYRFRCILRRRLHHALKDNIKSKKTLELLGCSIEFLKKHLQKQFKSGMSFSNYGKWHIDHIRPCASFNLSKPEEQKKCFNYKNLQPLWAKDNLSKNKK